MKTVAYLNNGNSKICVDDHCYVLFNRLGALGLRKDMWSYTSHLFGEALAVLRTLPENPDQALAIDPDKYEFPSELDSTTVEITE
jgi:hypothetical protein